MTVRIASCILIFSGSQIFAADTVDYLKQIKPIFSEACYRCHGPAAQKHGLRLDTAAFARKGSDENKVIIPGKSSESLLIKMITGTATGRPQMPFKGAPLSDERIALIKKWIDEGANGPTDEKPGEFRHWSFVLPVRVEPPRVKSKNWARNPIDNFILARLEKEKIKPSPEADCTTLIRRVSLDLIGLPPKPEEVDAFLNDKSPDAYEKLVDRLLASPHFGERWARHWLDQARYADSNGYSIDAPRQIWPWRDWVINALNRDMPFDQFTIEQLAGDLLPNATLNQKIATGFHRNTQINQEGGIDKEQFRVDSIIDRVNTTGSTWLGLTIGCCQCHDHKFDPLLQKEYYQFFAFLNNQDEPEMEIATADSRAKKEALQKEIEKAESELMSYVDSLAGEISKWQKSLTPEQVAHLKAEITTVLETPPDKRTLKQKLSLVGQIRKDDADFKKRRAKLTKLEKKKPDTATTMVLQERKEPRKTYLFIKGDFTRHGDVVTPGVPHVLPPLQNSGAGVSPAHPNRLDLARWIISTNNPLTARVTMNRTWLHYFGKGIVETENDFGTQGSEPSHPELLDWLATEFMQRGWSLKKMHRLIVTSATYRQSSHVRPELKDIDPYNKLLARQSRVRLDSEIVRDAALSAAGLLSEKVGGPSVYPPIPDGVMTLGQTKREWKVSEGRDRYRRGLYTFFFRATPPPELMVFDSPESTSACTRRIRSNTPLQSLTLLNDQGFVEMAQGLASRVLRNETQTDEQKIDLAFRLCLSRPPEIEERKRLAQLLDSERQKFKAAPEEAKAIASKKMLPLTDVAQLAAWTTVSRVLLNLDETITRE